MDQDAGSNTAGRIETRELRCFVAVAEELHFGRAAERLGIAQPPLSRTISHLERRLGFTLLERTSRKVSLTQAGNVLLSEGRNVLAALTAAERRTRQAATSQVGLVLAAKAGTADELLAKLVDSYAGEPGAVPVEILLCESQLQRTLLLEGRADVALMHHPFESTAGLDTQDLRTEGQVAVLPAAHPLATQAHVRSNDVAALPNLPMARWRAPDGVFPDGPGPEIHNLTQLFQLIALGRGTAIVPQSTSTDLRRDLTTVPVVDAPTVTTVIAWPPNSHSRAVAALIRLASSL